MKTFAAIVIAVLLVGGAMSLLFGGGGSGATGAQGVASTENGTQIVEISARGGYSPRVTSAKAGVATTLRVKTRGTFDCSSALVIPSLGYRANLPPSGMTEIQIPPQSAGTSLRGVCVMGMYNFSINFN